MSSYANIFEFTRFRRYLAVYQEQRALVEDGFSRTEFCKQLKLPNTRSYFNDVVRGKRVSKTMIERFLKVLNLNEEETLYFRAMVAFDQARSPQARSLAFAQMQKIHPSPKSILEPDAFEYYSKWYHSAIFAILDVLDIGDDFTVLEHSITPPVSRATIRESMELLSRLKLIQKNDSGCWKPTRDRISSGANSQEQLIKQYQAQCLELSKQALETGDNKTQNTTAMIFSVSQQAKQQIEQALNEFRNQVYKLVAEDNDASSQVLHLNINMAALLKQGEQQ
jgi:uncharacterized protein (TIGR02147 family)